MNKYNLDSRFEDFAASVVLIFNPQPTSFAADYLAKQLIRSARVRQLSILVSLKAQNQIKTRLIS